MILLPIRFLVVLTEAKSNNCKLPLDAPEEKAGVCLIILTPRFHKRFLWSRLHGINVKDIENVPSLVECLTGSHLPSVTTD